MLQSDDFSLLPCTKEDVSAIASRGHMAQGVCLMNRIKLSAVNCDGSLRLWRGPEVKISVFASRHFDADD